MVQTRVRIRFCKQGDLRLISHRDLVRTLERLFRRAGVGVQMSEGFHPKPRMRFPSALGLGLEGLDEVFEVDLAEPWDSEQLRAVLSAQAPPGLSFHAVEAVPENSKKAQATSQTLTVPLPSDRHDEIAERVDQLLACDSYAVRRPDRVDAIDIRPLIEDLEVTGCELRMKLRITHEAGVRPRDILEALGLTDWEAQGMIVARTQVELQP